MHRFFGRCHAALLTGSRGQGTVEYVALILLVALVMAGVVAAMKGFKTDEGKELGDIILGKIKEAFDRNPALDNLMLDPYFQGELERAQGGWRRVASVAVTHGLPIPAMSSALSYYDGYRAERLPANLLQAQRDYFGAHTYERVDRPRGEFFHTNWTGRGGTTSSTTYSV